MRACRNRLWTVHPLTGWQTHYAVLATQQPVGTPELYEQARVALAAADSSLITLVRETYGSDDVRDMLRKAQVEPDAAFGSAKAMRAAIDTALERAWAAAPQWFGRLPASELVVEPFPAYQQGSVPGGQYSPPAITIQAGIRRGRSRAC